MYVPRPKKELRRNAIDGFIKTVEHLCLKKNIDFYLEEIDKINNLLL